MKRLFIAFLVSFTTLISAQTNQNLDAASFKKMMEKKNTVVVDLRTPDEINSKGKIKGAVEIDFLAKDAEEKVLKLDKNKTYLLYCAGGGRSGDCKDLMTQKGFKNVFHLTKGFGDWVKAGYEVETKNKK